MQTKQSYDNEQVRNVCAALVAVCECACEVVCSERNTPVVFLRDRNSGDDCVRFVRNRLVQIVADRRVEKVSP